MRRINGKLSQKLFISKKLINIYHNAKFKIEKLVFRSKQNIYIFIYNQKIYD